MVKRKFDSSETAADRCTKQLKLVPFPSYQPDFDVDMSDSSSSPTESLFADHTHMRLDSGASVSSVSSDGFSTPPLNDKSVGILQPKSSFIHNGNCTQIPKLRIACSSGPNGSRTMWSHCEECGAIEMIDPDY